MAKRDKVAIKKLEASFKLIGNAVVGDYTYNMDVSSKKSNWTYHQLKLGVETPEQGVIFAEAMGGFAEGGENVVYVHGKKMNERNQEIDDYQSKWTIDWDDRLNEDLYAEVGDNCFYTVGIEKDANDKTFYKKFLTQYDMIAYVKEHLEKDMVVKVEGSLNYSVYDDKTQVKKDIRSIMLSYLPVEKHGAFFTQAVLVDSDSVEKIDKDKNTYGINVYVSDYVGKVEVPGQTKKLEIKANAVFARRFEIEHKDDVKTAKLLKMLFGAKKEEVWEVIVEGVISKGASLVTTTIDDLPDDIKELIEYGAMTEEEALERCVGKGSKIETYIIQKPKIKVIEKDGVKTPTVEIHKDKYQREDYVTYQQLLASKGVVVEEEVVIDEEEEEFNLDDFDME